MHLRINRKAQRNNRGANLAGRADAELPRKPDTAAAAAAADPTVDPPKALRIDSSGL